LEHWRDFASGALLLSEIAKQEAVALRIEVGGSGRLQTVLAQQTQPRAADPLTHERQKTQ